MGEQPVFEDENGRRYILGNDGEIHYLADGRKPKFRKQPISTVIIAALITGICGIIAAMIGAIQVGTENKPLACGINSSIIQGIFACNSSVNVTELSLAITVESPIQQTLRAVELTQTALASTPSYTPTSIFALTETAIFQTQTALAQPSATLEKNLTLEPTFTMTFTSLAVTAIPATSTSIQITSAPYYSYGLAWQYDNAARTMTWIGATDGREDIWQPTGEPLDKIRTGYTAIFGPMDVSGEIFACFLTLNGQQAKNACDGVNIPVEAGQIYKVTSSGALGGFRWCPAPNTGHRINNPNYICK